MGKEHFHFLAQPHRDDILLGFGNIPGDLTGIFMFFAGDGAEVGIGAAFFGQARLTRQFQCAIFGDAFVAWSSVGIRIIAAELFE